MAYGARFGLLTVAGTVSAQIVQLCLVALHMAQILGEMGVWFDWLRWVGVAYLLYLGVMQWRAPPVDLTRIQPEPKSPRAIYMRALLVSLTNPKTLFFYGAFFPQFIVLDRPVGSQVALLSVTFLVLAMLIDGAWALLAGRARGVLARRGRLRNRVAGGFLIGAAGALALAHRR